MQRKIWISAISLILFFSVLYGIEIHSSIISFIDGKMASFAILVRNPIMDKLMVYVTNIGGPAGAAVTFAIFSLVIILKKHPDYFYIFTTSFVFSIISEFTIKQLVERMRPINYLIKETGFSFPSGHSIAATIFLISAVFLIAPVIKNTALKWLFLALSCILFPAVAFSRIYLSVHFASDVLGSIFLGTAIFAITDIIIIKLLRKDPKNVISNP